MKQQCPPHKSNVCIKCAGLVVLDYCLSSLCEWVRHLRCINCGWVGLEEPK